MQITLKDRETITGVVTVETQPVDVSGMPQLSAEVVVHAVSGTTPDCQLQLQTSNNLEDWSNIGGTWSETAVGATQQGYGVTGDNYQRYVRFQIAVTGTSPMFNYSLYLNTYASS